MADVSPGWAVQIFGDQIDLNDLSQFLTPPFGVWIEEYQPATGPTQTLLRSKNWETLTASEEVEADAKRVIDRLNGEMLLLLKDASPLSTANGAIKFGPNGERHISVVAAGGSINIEIGRARQGGKLSSEQIERLRKWFSDAESDETRAELFRQILRADNWFDLYKCIELAEQIAKGGLRNNLQWKDTRETANYHRHAPGPKYRVPPAPPKLSNARQFVIDTIVSILS
jgi:hypothetical protein